MFNIKLLITGIISLLLVSCGANSDLLKIADTLTENAVVETTFFQLNQNSLVVSNAEQSVSAVSFTTKDAQSWRVESSTSFCILKNTKTEGVGSSTISVFLTENKETASRSCSIVFVVPGVFPAPVLNITQMGVAPFLSVNTSSIILPNANPSSIVVVSNTNWSATSSVSWCKISAGSEAASNSITGSGTLQVSIRVEANTGNKIRSCILSFSAQNVTPLQSIVTQFGTSDSIVVQDANLVANINTSTTSLTESVIRFASNTTSDVTLASSTTNYMFNVTSNVAYTVTVPDLQNQSPLQQWLRVNTSNRAGAGNTSSNIGLFLQPNTSNDDRPPVNVVVTAGSVQKIITIRQKGTSPHIILSSNQFNALSVSTGVSVGVQSSTGWRASVTNGISWCKVRSVSTSFSVTALSNTGSDSRVCTVKVSTVTGNQSQDFTLTQLGSATSILINSTTALNIPYHGSIILEKLITSNTGYTVSSNNSSLCYLPLTNYSAGLDIPVIVSLAVNSRSVARSCTITLSASGVSRQFVINQAAKPAVLNVSASTVTVLPTDTSTSGVSIVVDSTVDWTATVTSGSCAITPASSTRDKENIVISFSGINSGATVRDICTVTFAGVNNGVTYSKTISVKQLGSNDSLVLSSNRSDIAYTQNSSDFSLTTNASWRISSLSNTCTVATQLTPGTAITSGLRGNYSLRIAFISTEASATDRTCSATFTTTEGTGGTASQTYTLTKAQTPTITLVAGSGQTLTSGNLTQNVASIASTVSFPVTLATASETMAVTFKSNVAWSIVSDQSYCMVDANNNSGSGAGTDDISKNITVLANLSTTTRTCTFTFSGTDAVDKTLTITQYGQAILVGSSSNNVFSTVNLLVRTTSSNTLDALGSIPAVSSTSTSVSYNVLVASGRSAKLLVSNADTLGCTGSTDIPGSANNISTGTIGYSFTENTTRTVRSCTVQLSAYPSISYSGTVVSVTSTINQGATDIYIKTNTADTQYLSSVSVLSTATQTTFKVRANGGYTSTVSSQTAGMGCSVSSNATASDDTEKDVIVQFTENTSISVNTCTVQFTSNTNSIVRSISITQAKRVRLMYHANGATGNAPNTMNVAVGVSISLPGGGSLSIAGFSFIGWNTSANDIMALDTYVPLSDATLYAIFTPIIDVDTDGDGLINITNQAQFLNMQHNLAGTSYKRSAVAAGLTGGCPVSGCNGYELNAEIVFGFTTSCDITTTQNTNQALNAPLIKNYDGNSVAFTTDRTRCLSFTLFGRISTTDCGAITFTNRGYGASRTFQYEPISTNPLAKFGDQNCYVDTTQPSTAFTGFTGTFNGNGFNVSGMRIANGVRTTSASTYFTSGTISSVTFR